MLRRMTPTRGRPRAPGAAGAVPRGAELPAHLVSVASRLFAEHGYEGTSVQAVVAAAGVTKGALYHYFSSKEDLLHEIYGRVLRLQTAHLEELADADLPVAERVHAAAADVVRTSVDNLDDTVIFFRSLHQLSEDKRQQVRAERRRYHERFRALVAEGQEDASFRRDVPADLVVDYFFGAVHHLGSWYRPDGTLTGTELGRHYADLLLSGLRP